MTSGVLTTLVDTRHERIRGEMRGQYSAGIHSHPDKKTLYQLSESNQTILIYFQKNVVET